MPILAASAIIGAGIGVYNAVQSSQDKKKAERELDSWERTHPQDFKTGQQIYTEAASATPTGFSPQETAAFQQNLARRSNQARRMATDRNPNLSPAINAAINYGNIGALVNFSAQDAQLRRQLISEKVGLIRGQSNAQTQFNQNVSAQYGQAIQQQKENLTNSLYNVANSAAAYGYYTGGTGTGTGGNRTMGTTTTAAGTTAPPASSPNPVGGDQWAANLYGNPAGRYQPYGNYAIGQTTQRPTTPPSNQLPPYQSVWETNQYFKTPY